MNDRRFPTHKARGEVVRVLRVLEYVGPRNWIESTLAQNAVKGNRDFGSQCTIRESIIGDFPEVVGEVMPQMTEGDLGLIRVDYGWTLRWKVRPKYGVPRPDGEHWFVVDRKEIYYFLTEQAACACCIDNGLSYGLIGHYVPAPYWGPRP